MNTKKDKEANEFLDPNDWQGFIRYLSDTNRFILSEYWEKFVVTIINTAHKRTKILKKNRKLYRARIGTSFVEVEDGMRDDCPIFPDEMGPPPKDLVRAGRTNPEGIPYLYLASKIETAIAEVKPWIRSTVTIGCFKIEADLKILDTSHDNTDKSSIIFEWIEGFDIRKRPIHNISPAEKEACIWGDINKSFSRPISPNDSPLKYLSTQFLSEKLKTEGYDGVGYKSSLNNEGYNIVLFDSQKAKCIRCHMYEIKMIAYDFEESGNPIFLSNDDKVCGNRIVSIDPLDDDNREKQVSDGK